MSEQVTKAARTFFPNGKVESEVTLTDGKPNGVAKYWHPDGKLKTVMHMVQGQPTGRMRCWDETGTLITETYLLDGRQISKKKYSEACKRDPSLPEPNDDGEDSGRELPSPMILKRHPPVSDAERKLHAETVAKFLADRNQAEARQWLKSSSASGRHNLGEMTPDASRQVIEDGYLAGAMCILAVGIHRAENGSETTSHLIVELPVSAVQRRDVFKWGDNLAHASGFDSQQDWGQKELYIFLD
jgi:hypothetical protein